MKFPKLISTVFHPLFMPLMGMLLVFNSSSYINSSIPKNIQWVTLFTIFIFTCLFPMLNILYLHRKGLINSVYLETREERQLPYGITIAFYFILYYFLKELQLPPVLYLVILGSTLASVMAFIINLKWKISAHMIGIGGMIGAILGISERLTLDLNSILIALFCIAGLIGFSRLRLKAHSPFQIYLGFFVGMGSVLLMVI
ncbi:MAG: hypothetical protein JKY52_13740 [Flavobacteriales bacterium]|nr:hypothetical protein [Flavobacteriales bacterium]